MTEATKIKLGEQVMDRVTKYRGIVISRTERLYGSTSIQIQPGGVTTAGKPLPAVWIPEERAIHVDENGKES